MSDMFAPRVRTFVVRPVAPTRPLPIGYGLAIGAALSLALWAGAAALVARVLG